MGRAALAVTAIVVASAAAFTLWCLSGELPAPGSGTAEQPPVVPATPDALRPAPPTTPRAEVRTDGTAVGNAVIVTVVDEDDGRAVTNAEVCYHSTRISLRPDTEEGRFALAHPGNDDEVCLRFGRRAHTGADGSVRLPWLDNGMLVACQHNERFGALRLSQRQPPKHGWRLVLSRRSSLRVEVVDARGQPAAGVPIVVTSAPGATHDRPQPMFTGVTSQPDGVLLVPRPEMRLPERAKVVRVIADLPGVDIAAEVVLGGTLQHVRLQLPPLAELAFELRDRQGAPLFDRARVTVVPADAPTSNLVLEHEWSTTIEAETPLTLLVVAAHREYVARTSAQGQVLEARAGPFAAGARSVVTLSADAGSTSVTGRALDEMCEPLRSVPILLRWNVGRGQGAIRSQTDSDGRFRFILPQADAAAVESAQLELARSPESIATLGLAGPLPTAGVDVGEVLLAPAPLIASGRLDVIGEGGLDDAIEIVAVREAVIEHDGRTISYQRDNPAVKVRDVAPGRFEVRGTIGAQRHWLVVRSDAHLPSQPVELVAGAHDLVLRLEKGSSLDVEVLLDGRLSPHSVQLRLRRQGSEESREPSREHTDRSTYTWQGLASGIYVLDVATADDPTPLTSIEGIAVRAGQDTRDPRLHPLDLRGRLRAIVITAMDERGQRIFARQGEVRIAGRPRASVPMTAGQATVVTTEPALDLVVDVDGFRLVTLNGITADTTATLQPGWRIRLRPLQQPYREVKFAVGTTRGVIRRAVLTAPAPDVDLVVGSIGAHWLTAIARSDGAVRPQELEVSPGEILVRDTDDVQTFDITLTPKGR